MIQTLSTNEAAHILLSDDNASWSYYGAVALVEYLEELEANDREPMECNATAIRSEWSEYMSCAEAAEEYGQTPTASVDDDDDEEAWEAECEKWLNDRTVIVTHRSGVIVRQF